MLLPSTAAAAPSKPPSRVPRDRYGRQLSAPGGAAAMSREPGRRRLAHGEEVRGRPQPWRGGLRCRPGARLIGASRWEARRSATTWSDPPGLVRGFGVLLSLGKQTSPFCPEQHRRARRTAASAATLASINTVVACPASIREHRARHRLPVGGRHGRRRPESGCGTRGRTRPATTHRLWRSNTCAGRRPRGGRRRTARPRVPPAAARARRTRGQHPTATLDPAASRGRAARACPATSSSTRRRGARYVNGLEVAVLHVRVAPQRHLQQTRLDPRGVHLLDVLRRVPLLARNG